eukprot:4141945-Pleurochrysis_carterae.AAC.1
MTGGCCVLLCTPKGQGRVPVLSGPGVPGAGTCACCATSGHARGRAGAGSPCHARPPSFPSDGGGRG